MQGMQPYSEDLRRRIVLAVEVGGTSKSAAARLFGVSLSSAKRYVSLAQRGASLAPRKGGGRPPKVDETVRKLLEEDGKERPAATVHERCCAFFRASRARVSACLLSNRFEVETELGSSPCLGQRF